MVFDPATLAVAALLASGVAMAVWYRSPLRILVGLELAASGAAAGLVLWAGSLGFYAAVVVVDTALAAVFAAAAYHALRGVEEGDVDRA